MIEFYTIGVYGSTEDSFFRNLTNAQIDLFIDIRQRRGVRGSQYKYVNSNYLQTKLKELGIDYLYVKDLAPTKEIRMKQKESDILNGENKHKRTKLSHIFIHEYTNQILDYFDLKSLIKKITLNGYKRIVLFCIEEKPESCHRSLVANRIHNIFSCPITNL